ncbi:hypothetical protein ACQY0O_004266 [Thecaphora frezii]
MRGLNFFLLTILVGLAFTDVVRSDSVDDKLIFKALSGFETAKNAAKGNPVPSDVKYKQLSVGPSTSEQHPVKTPPTTPATDPTTSEPKKKGVTYAADKGRSEYKKNRNKKHDKDGQKRHKQKDDKDKDPKQEEQDNQDDDGKHK